MQAALCLLLRFVPAQASAADRSVRTGATATAIVELFTSEGCSSCPPADALLREISLKMLSGQTVIGLSEHVTYWNNLGWRDPYSSEAFTARQEKYATRFALGGPYTPEIVVNGEEQFAGGDRRRLQQALQREGTRTRIDVGLSGAALSSDGLSAKLTVRGVVSTPLDLYACVTDDEDSTQVLRGENAGSVLNHVAVVRTLERLQQIAAPGEESLRIQVPAALRASWKKGHHLIVFLQAPQQGRIAGAAALAL